MALDIVKNARPELVTSAAPSYGSNSVVKGGGSSGLIVDRYTGAVRGHTSDLMPLGKTGKPTRQPAGQKGGITLFGPPGSGAVFEVGSSSAGPDYSSWTDGSGNPVGYSSDLGGSAAAVGSLPVYPHAPVASQYGMDQATAYQEALANTAHLREVYDLKLAGLNPVLSATGGRGASVFSGEVAYPMAFGATSGTGGGSASAAYSGGGAGGSKGSSATGTLQSWLKGDYNAQSAVASVASAVVGGVTKSFPLGAAAYYATKSILGNIFKR